MAAIPIIYFSVKLLLVRVSKDNGMTWSDNEVSQDTKDYLWSDKYELINNEHYHPNKFVEYMKNISKDNSKYTYNFYFKYIFFNHPMDNEYQNIFYVNNDNMRLIN